MISIVNYFSISLFFGGVVALISGFVVFLTNKKSFTNISWLLLNISSAVWSFGYLVMILTKNEFVAYISNIILHVGAIFIPLFYLMFVVAITNNLDRYRKMFLFVLPYTLFFMVFSGTDYFVSSVYPKFIFNFAPNAGPLYIYFTIYFVALIIFSYLTLLKRINSLDNKSERSQLWYVLFSSMFGFIGGGSVFFLTFNIQVPPYPIILFAIYPLIITRAIVKHNLFSTKIIDVEVLSLLILSVFLVRVILSNGFYEILINIILFIVASILSWFLIKGVYRESESRDEIKKLADGLEKKNAQLSKVNAKLVEIDKHKSDFVSIAAHQLRTPASVIKNYVSMIKQGIYGELPETLKDPIDRISENGTLLSETISTILDISHIEDKNHPSNFQDTNIKEMVEKDIPEFAEIAKKKGLELALEVKEGGGYMMKADADKLKHVFINLIDNAIKYTEQGGVKVSVYEEGNNICVDVKDTGRGMSKVFAGTQLYQKFAREESVAKNVSGNGLGMYFVKEVIDLHKGKISLYTQEGKGTTFTVCLPKELKEKKKVTRAKKEAVSV